MNNTVDIRLPNIDGKTDREQLRQIRSYLYQTAQQLQYALGNISAYQGQTAEAIQKAYGGGTAPSKGSAATFNSIKSLIIKSADIVDAYYEEINNRLESVYVAQSTFGTFAEETSQSITENADGITRAFDSIQSIESTLAEIRNQNLGVSAYVRTGLLYYEDSGFPVYGLEIGQENTVDGVKVFNKFARFTSDRLSFYDNNDTEVAFISDQKLYINNVEITGSFRMGGFLDSVRPGKDIVTKWVG